MSSPTLSHISADTDLARLDVDAIVVGIFSRDKTLELGPGAAAVDTALQGRLLETLCQLGATGGANQVTKLPSFGATTAPVIVAVGLGERRDDGPSAAAVRAASGAATRSLAGSERIAIALASEDADLLRPAAEGAALAAYEFLAFKSAKALAATVRQAPVSAIGLVSPGSDNKPDTELRRAEILAAAVRQTRDWVNTPPNHLRPADLADAVTTFASTAGVTATVLDDTELAAGGYGGLLAVGGGSSAGPRLAVLSYRPEGQAEAPSVALIGKGITFDTGGISIKPAAGMHEMKDDMSGAAAVAAAVVAIARLRLPVAVTGYLPIAENMPSGSAYRPGDVITLYGGQQVEILNTDAEGRLVLGDAIGRACEENPDYLIETSTLTGGQVISLGKRISGVMGSDELCQRIVAAGERTGEKMWQMPMAEDVRAGMDSAIADFSQVNSSMDRAGHMLQGGLFLAECVTEGTTWAHIDIAGPAYNTGGAYGYTPKGATGTPVRTLVEVVEDIAAKG